MSDTSVMKPIECRVCGEAADPKRSYAGLCRTCGQKREVYAAAALQALIDVDDQFIESRVRKTTTEAMAYAEEMIKLDRGSAVDE